MEKQRKWKTTRVLVGIIWALIIIVGIFIVGIKILGKGNREMEKLTEIHEYHTELFGENVYIFTPEDPAEEVCEILNQIWEKQETNQFGTERYGIYFMPGTYDESIEVQVGYYMEVAGLGKEVSDTSIASLNCTARWLGDDSNHNACCNFWRGVQNLTINDDVMWAVSQATFMRDVKINGNLALHDENGWASGGFLANSVIDGVVDSGSQQQWLSRNSDWNLWIGQNWNMVFVGMDGKDAPTGTWPGTKYTSVSETPLIREKPYLYYDEVYVYQVFVPDLVENTSGTNKDASGSSIEMDACYVVKEGIDTAETINEALRNGKNLIITPGIYELDQPIIIDREGTIVMGMGLATLIPTEGNACIEIGDVSDVIISGLLFDAGEKESDVLLRVGTDKEMQTEKYISLSDLFFRVGGNPGYVAKTKTCVEINSDRVIGDNFWVWRADHGDGVAWDLNTAANGIIVNGDDVTIYALMVEHFQEYQTIWNGESGKVYFYQSEIPYDVPNQEAWMSQEGTVNGFASYKVSDNVETHEAWGVGIYSYHRDAAVDLNCVMEIPDKDEVKVHNICAIMITGNPGISHVINDQGDACIYGGDRKIIVEYANGIQK